ncbi:hypothetical protein Hanom_Chr15g01394241 [Helianthus anomalus]
MYMIKVQAPMHLIQINHSSITCYGFKNANIRTLQPLEMRTETNYSNFLIKDMSFSIFSMASSSCPRPLDCINIFKL